MVVFGEEGRCLERDVGGGECPTVTPGRGCRMQMPGGSERCLSAAAAAARCSIDRDQSGRSPLSANAGHLPSHELDTCPLSKVSKRLFSGPRSSFYCLGHFKNVYDDDDDDLYSADHK